MPQWCTNYGKRRKIDENFHLSHIFQILQFFRVLTRNQPELHIIQLTQTVSKGHTLLLQLIKRDFYFN